MNFWERRSAKPSRGNPAGLRWKSTSERRGLRVRADSSQHPEGAPEALENPAPLLRKQKLENLGGFDVVVGEVGLGEASLKAIEGRERGRKMKIWRIEIR